MTNKIKRLFFDIETSYNIGSFWKLGQQFISYDNIIHERAIICICYKWEDEKKVHHLTWDHNQNDKAMLQQFLKVLNEADEIVGQNHEDFDIKWLRTRCLYHQIPMFPNYSTLDTYKKSRSGFRFNSNALDYIAKFLKLGEKVKMSIKDWDNVILRKDQKALDKMVKYCKQDVLLLQEVYSRLTPYITPKIHAGMILGNGKASCPHCGSVSLKLSKTRTTSIGAKKYQMQCNSCNKYHTVSETTFKQITP